MAEYGAINSACCSILLACVVYLHAKDSVIFIDRFSVHRLFGLLVSDVANACARPNVCILFAYHWNSYWDLGSQQAIARKIINPVLD